MPRSDWDCKRSARVVTLIAIRRTGGQVFSKPLLEIALIRARMCELLGAINHPENADVYFTIGLFSSLDAFLDRPLVDILKDLPITAEMRRALLSYEGPMGMLLKSVIAFERGEFESVGQAGLNDSAIQNAYVSALAWGHLEANATHNDACVTQENATRQPAGGHTQNS